MSSFRLNRSLLPSIPRVSRGSIYQMARFCSQMNMDMNAKKSYSIHVIVSDEMREVLRSQPKQYQYAKGKLKYPDDDSLTIEDTCALIEKRFPAFRRIPYSLFYRQHGVLHYSRPIDNNDTLKQIIQESTDDCPMQIIITNPVTTTYNNMPTPDESPTFTMLSFYKFSKIKNPDDAIETLLDRWKPFKVFGRVYVAEEGVNAQMAVPTNVFENFRECVRTISFLGDILINMDKELTRDEYFKILPFRSLNVKRRNQIVTDGLQEPLDWNKCGKLLDPISFHEAAKNPEVVMFDCRNSYESTIGKFKNAIPLDTLTFKDSWEALEEKLKDKDKSTPILTYCTGGIRCIKTNAYITQKLKFENVASLHGGIISYNRELNKTLPGEKSLFEGVNYVFDDRMGSRVTEDVLSQCETCGGPCDTYVNCANKICSVRFIQCQNCSTTYSGCCSQYCAKVKNEQKVDPFEKRKLLNTQSQKELNKMNKIEFNKVATEKTSEFIPDSLYDTLEDYCNKYSSGVESSILKQVRDSTVKAYPNATRMLCSINQGRFLTMMTSIKRPQRILELGTFTGYSTLCFLQGIPSDMRTNDIIVTVDSDKTSSSIARKHFEEAQATTWIQQIGDRALEALKQMQTSASDNRFDLVFLDCDKREYIEYVKILAGLKNGPSLLNDGALILVDNTLWKGLVLRYTDEEFVNKSKNEPGDFGDAKRMERIGIAMHSFNTYCQNLTCFNQFIMPIRDGLTILQYKKPHESSPQNLNQE